MQLPIFPVNGGGSSGGSKLIARQKMFNVFDQADYRAVEYSMTLPNRSAFFFFLTMPYNALGNVGLTIDNAVFDSISVSAGGAGNAMGGFGGQPGNVVIRRGLRVRDMPEFEKVVINVGAQADVDFPGGGDTEFYAAWLDDDYNLILPEKYAEFYCYARGGSPGTDPADADQFKLFWGTRFANPGPGRLFDPRDTVLDSDVACANNSEGPAAGGAADGIHSQIGGRSFNAAGLGAFGGGPGAAGGSAAINFSRPEVGYAVHDAFGCGGGANPAGGNGGAGGFPGAGGGACLEGNIPGHSGAGEQRFVVYKEVLIDV